MSSFTNPLVIEELRPEMWQISEDFEFHVGYKNSRVRVHVAKGEVTDLGSVPWYLRWAVKKRGKWDQANAMHDQLYAEKAVPRIVSDILWLQAMEVLGEPRFSRWVAFLGVRCFGWYRWHFPQY
jgi:hypothetical protein